MSTNDETTTETYRIEYTYPYLENRGTTDFTRECLTYEEAVGEMDRNSQDYGRIVNIQKRKVVKTVWRTDLEKMKKLDELTANQKVAEGIV